MLRVCGGIGAAMAHVNLPGVEFVGVYRNCGHTTMSPISCCYPLSPAGVWRSKHWKRCYMNGPRLATRHALRGLPDDVVRTIGHQDDPDEYAKSLLAIVADQARHRARLNRSRQAAALLREYSFYRTLGKAVDAVRLGGPQIARVPAIGQERSNPIDP